MGRDTVSFASALKGALREDPDIIPLGEMRDYETISMALTAAKTGHLVFRTLHIRRGGNHQPDYRCLSGRRTTAARFMVAYRFNW